MPNPAELSPSAVEIPDPQLHEAVVLDDAKAFGEEVRCSRPELDALLADDPMPWTPITVAGLGTFYPKKGDRATIAFPDGGMPVISQFFPAVGAVPDVSF